MNRENVQKLIDHLKQVPDGAFNLSTWIDVQSTARLGVEMDSWNAEWLLIRDRTLAGRVLATQAGSAGEHTCGTAACIAGYAALIAASEGVVLAETEELPGLPVHDVQVLALSWLGIGREVGRALFTPNSAGVCELRIHADHVPNWYVVTANHAIAVLEHLLATGEVDWRRAGWTKEDFSPGMIGIAEDGVSYEEDARDL
jgi:hypothetical protein